MVQVWALHALYLIADSGGPVFRSHVEQTLSLCMKLLLSVSRQHSEVFHCVGKCLSALITGTIVCKITIEFSLDFHRNNRSRMYLHTSAHHFVHGALYVGLRTIDVF